MVTSKVKDYLDRTASRYKNITHPLAFTAQETAASIHIKGKEFAKTVMVKIDGQLAMAVLPASQKIDFELLKSILDAGEVRLCTEAEFRNKFPDCEAGAMPPLGKLYDVDVYMAKCLLDNKEIFFNAGSHTDAVELTMDEFNRIVNPIVLDFTKKIKI
ncbi:MAG: YbaK/EbsC family protein [Ignavibacteria bacterium]|jgi:Ala-tRNA(Pro) deacylase|nr:YbaK/EbsC family protein [Ignavibacteria bacterium]MCU7502118.1 YbaK/EbsC family protein [Ignavibacteria bacterium]MCU7515520.1 YbaK/EbsC family protein [Ignavibacteria bacterium]